MPENQVLAALLGLHAQTSLHPGAGTALGVVDLPIQRERHTHWPTIPGSALKGVLRDACRERHKGNRSRKDADSDDFLVAAFGPPTESANESAGALSITDARLLAFPVRSLKGVFAWVTCPAVLERLERDLDLARGTPVPWKAPEVKDAQVVLPVADAPCLVQGKHVVLEEFLFQRTETTCGPLADWVAQNLLPETDPYATTRARFQKSLLVLSNDFFTHFARFATEVVARVGLDYETKTVRHGALFYEEFLPPETLLYSVVLTNGARSKATNGRDAKAILQDLREFLPHIIQVGANQTTGKGYCATRLWPQGGA